MAVSVRMIEDLIDMYVTKVMLNESATTSTVAVDGNTIEKVDRYVFLGNTVTQAGVLLPEIKRRIALGWATFSEVGGQHHEEQEG